jgi:hypothetical protein
MPNSFQAISRELVISRGYGGPQIGKALSIQCDFLAIPLHCIRIERVVKIMTHLRSKTFVLSVVFLISVFGGARAQQPEQDPPRDNISGTWTIYAQNIDKAGSSLKTADILQNGNLLTGKFKGPHQSGKLQGWVSGQHVVFSTDTRTVLTFRGQIHGNTMSGLYGIRGRHAEWHAERTGN